MTTTNAVVIVAAVWTVGLLIIWAVLKSGADADRRLEQMRRDFAEQEARDHQDHEDINW